MKLPTSKKRVNRSLLHYTALLYGWTKIGKTTFLADAGRVLILCTEPGVEALEVYEVQVTSWDAPLEQITAQDGRQVYSGGLIWACAEIERAVASGEPLPWDCIAIDTIDNAWTMCQDYTCGKLGIRHPADAGYGKGFDAVKTEFRRVLTKLARLPLGLWLTSHARTISVETQDGSRYDRITTTLPNSARGIVLGLCDMVLLADMEIVGEDDALEERRVIRTKPTVRYDAGDRTGRLPATIDLSYAAFVAAWEDAVQSRGGSQ